MVIFAYDGSFEGLLCAIWDAYGLKMRPDEIIVEGEPTPMFCETVRTIITDPNHAERVWAGIKRNRSSLICNMLEHIWLSERTDRTRLLADYIYDIFDKPATVDPTDTKTLTLRRIATSVANERLRVIQFSRFRKVMDGSWFAPVAPDFNVLPLCIDHFAERFSTQQWIVYDVRRHYGYHFDTKHVIEIALPNDDRLADLPKEFLNDDEALFEAAWHDYFAHMTIRERINPTLQRQHLPMRFRRFMPEFNP